VTPERWELMRLMTEKTPDGRAMLVPARADALPEAALRAHLAEDIKRIDQAAQGDMSAFMGLAFASKESIFKMNHNEYKEALCAKLRLSG
jgi:hypothetical protein